MKVSMIVRTLLLIVALLNQYLVSKGMSPLPFNDEQIENGVSIVFTAIMVGVNWWKNNSVTKKAQRADEYFDKLKSK